MLEAYPLTPNPSPRRARGEKDKNLMDIIPLNNTYTSVDGMPIIDHVDPRIFTLTYFGNNCMDCNFCHDSCCQWGADIEMPRVEAILNQADAIEAYTGWGRDYWFRTDPDDFGIKTEPEYPSGQYTRTQVAELPPGRSPYNTTGCVFIDPHSRGCMLHGYALENNIEVHSIKPMICMLFPVSFHERTLIPAYELEFEDELACINHGTTLYHGARGDILHYFGPECVAELDRLARMHAIDPISHGIPLPIAE